MSEDIQKFFRKIIQIKATDSPNVQYAQAQLDKGITPDNTIIVPGVITYLEFLERLRTYDEEAKEIGLWAKFYKGAQTMLFPESMLTYCEKLADELVLRKVKRQAKSIGIDPAEGGDKTAMAAVDDYGLVDLQSQKTPDTSMIQDLALAFMHKHQLQPENIWMDRGGGGKQHADYLRKKGYNVPHSVGFGEKIGVQPKRGIHLFRDKVEIRDEQYIYFNRRAQMYGTLATLMDPTFGGFAIPRRFNIIKDQLRPIPKMFDDGRLKLPPKNHSGEDSGKKKDKSLVQLIGYSPDEADALVLAVYGLIGNKSHKPTAGAV